MQPVVAERCESVDPRVERTRNCVLAATRDLLAEGGIEAATVKAIAKLAGVNKTTVYRNWPDPHTLVHEALATLGQPSQLPDTGSLRDDLIAMFGALAANMQQPPWDRLLPSLIGAAARDPETRAFHGALTRNRRDTATQVIENAIERQEIPTDTSAKDLIESIVGPLYYRILMTKEPVTPENVTQLVDRVLASTDSNPQPAESHGRTADPAAE